MEGAGGGKLMAAEKANKNNNKKFILWFWLIFGGPVVGVFIRLTRRDFAAQLGLADGAGK